MYNVQCTMLSDAWNRSGSLEIINIIEINKRVWAHLIVFDVKWNWNQNQNQNKNKHNIKWIVNCKMNKIKKKTWKLRTILKSK